MRRSQEKREQQQQTALGGNRRKPRAAEYVVLGAQDEAGQDGSLDKQLALISASSLLCRPKFCQSGSFPFSIGQAH